MSSHYPVIIIGGGQAGLSMSYCLKQRGIDHLIFEKHRIGHTWRTQRWDSFCLVTPNWQCKLPGFEYPGSEPHGFMVKDQIVRYIEDYANSFGPPIVEGVGVSKLRVADGGDGFALSTGDGEYTAEQVVVAVGGYHRPSIPRMAERLPDDVLQLHSSQYKTSEQLPPGEVLVVGTGQSGCQIADDLHIAGRRVHLCVGGAPRTARRYRGKDVVDWLHEMGYYDLPVHQHPLKERVRAKANHYVTGRDGGRDIDLRKLALEGMQLYGRLKGIRGHMLHFVQELKKNLDQADEVAESIKTTIDKFIDKNGIARALEERYKPLWQPASEPEELDYRKAGITSVIWSIGFHSDFSWVEIPVFDGKGYPCHERGVTNKEGLYFLGLPWLYTWGSGRFSGVARDAGYLADRVVDQYQDSHGEAEFMLEESALGS